MCKQAASTHRKKQTITKVEQLINVAKKIYNGAKEIWNCCLFAEIWEQISQKQILYWQLITVSGFPVVRKE